jgi:hypothetical protein
MADAPTERQVIVLGHEFAVRATDHPNGRWRALAHRYGPRSGQRWPIRPIPGTEPPSRQPAAIVIGRWTAEGDSAQDALDALEERIRTAIEAAVGP